MKWRIANCGLRIQRTQRIHRAHIVATFARVSDSDPTMLRYLADRGIRPGMGLRVTDVQPFGGPVFVEVDGQEHALGGELAEKMRVEPVGGA